MVEISLLTSLRRGVFRTAATATSYPPRFLLQRHHCHNHLFRSYSYNSNDHRLARRNFSALVVSLSKYSLGPARIQSQPLLQYRYSTTTTTTDVVSKDSAPAFTVSNDAAPADSSSTLPKAANVIIIGGGIIGTSVAYHLGQLGVSDIVLLERDQLTSGTTWHAAGLINTFGSLSSTSTYMRMYSKNLYANILPELTGMNTGYMDIGFIELACDRDRLYYYRTVAAYNRYCGVPVQEISAEEVQARFPACDTTGVLAGFLVETDGRVNPYDTTMALAKAAKMTGQVQIVEGVLVERVITARTDAAVSLLPQVTGVELASGDVIACNIVVNCAGMWARQLGEKNQVYCIPNQAAEHYYLLTEPMADIDPTWPVIEDSSKCVYIRPEGGGLMLGLFESTGASWNTKSIPHDFSFGQIEPDWDRMVCYCSRSGFECL
jgi:glycine/D-amino acid oxidase-like deaminating enzyme